MGWDEYIDIPGEYAFVTGQQIEYTPGKIFDVIYAGWYSVTDQGVTQIKDKEPEKNEETLYGLLNWGWHLLGKGEVREAQHYLQRAKLRARSQEEQMDKLRAVIRGIIKNVHYAKDRDGNWHTYYDDKPYAAAATEAARDLLDKEEFYG